MGSYNFDSDHEINAGLCRYVYRRGIRFPYPLSPVFRQPYVVQFFITGPFLDIVNTLGNIYETIRGRIEAIINVPKNPRSVGDIISYITKSFRDVAGIVDEVMWYKKAVEQRTVVLYIDVQNGVLPLGFYLATVPPLEPSEHDVALTAVNLHRLLYNPEMPEMSRLTTKQYEDDYSYLYQHEEKEKEKTTLAEKVVNYVKKWVKLDEIIQLFKQAENKVQEIYDKFPKMGLSVFDSVIFYWYNNINLDIRLGDIYDAFRKGHVLIYSYGKDWMPESDRQNIRDFYDNYIEKSKDVPSSSASLSTISDLTYRRHSKVEFLGVSKRVEPVTTEQFTKAVLTAIRNRRKDMAFSALQVYQTYGLKFVPLLPYPVSNSVNSGLASFLTDYGAYRNSIDRAINDLLKNKQAISLSQSESFRKAAGEISKVMAAATGMTRGMASKMSIGGGSKDKDNEDKDKIDEINDADVESIFKVEYLPPQLEPDIDLAPDFRYYDTDSSNSAENTESNDPPYKYSVIEDYNNSAVFRPGRVIRWSSSISEDIHAQYGALYSLSKIKRFGSPEGEMPIAAQEYGEMLKKVFFPHYDNAFELSTFIKTLGDNAQLEAIRSAYMGAEGAVLTIYDDMEKDPQRDEKIQETINRTVNRMQVVRSIIDESVFKLIKYYQLLMGLSGSDVSAPMHYMASLEPFSTLVKDLPEIARVYLKDIDTAMARVLGSEVAAINMGAQQVDSNACVPAKYFSIYKDFLPLRNLSIKYDDIETTNIDFFGYNFSIPSTWNSLKPNVRVSVIDFFGQPFTRYWQKYRKLVFRNNGAWPILNMAFILDVIGLDKSFNVTDLISLLVLPKSINMTEIDYDSSNPLPEAGTVDIDFEVIGFIDYVDLISQDDALVRVFNVIETVNGNRVVDRYNRFSEWYHMHNFNPLPAKYGLYSTNGEKNAKAINEVVKRVTANTPFRGSQFHPESIRIYEPQHFGRTISTKAMLDSKNK